MYIGHGVCMMDHTPCGIVLVVYFVLCSVVSIEKRMTHQYESDGVAEWLMRSVTNHARSTRVGSNPRRRNHLS